LYIGKRRFEGEIEDLIIDRTAFEFVHQSKTVLDPPDPNLVGGAPVGILGDD
jgi:hypothetical protein